MYAIFLEIPHFARDDITMDIQAGKTYMKRKMDTAIDGDIRKKYPKTESFFVLKFGDEDFSDDQFVFPEGISAINNEEFRDCNELVAVVIPHGVSSIGYGAFKRCCRLRLVTIPDSVTCIGEEAFYNCNILESIIIPDSVVSIGKSAFGSCFKLASVVIPKSVMFLEEMAFYNCSKLSSVIIEEGVISIGDMAFYQCNKLTSLIIPDSVTFIGKLAFYGCDVLSHIYIDANSKERFNEILAMLPDLVQQRIRANYKSFEKQAVTLIAAGRYESGFFKQNLIPKDILTSLLISLARQYGIPPCMINYTSGQMERDAGIDEENLRICAIQ